MARLSRVKSFGGPALGQETSGPMYIQPLLLMMVKELCGMGMPEMQKSALWTLISRLCRAGW